MTTEHDVEAMRKVRDLGHKFERALEMLPPSRERSLAITKIEEAVMWAAKGATK